MTDHERWVTLSAAQARGEELTRDERGFIESWSSLEDADDVEGSAWRAIGRLGDDPLPGERSDTALVQAVLSASIDLVAEPEAPARRPPATSSGVASRPTTRPRTKHAPRGRRDAVVQFVAGFGGVLGAAAIAIVGLTSTFDGAGRNANRELDPSAAEDAVIAERASGAAVANTSPATPRAAEQLALDEQADEASLGCVRLGAGAQACPSSDDAQLEIGAPLGDRLALSLTAGSVRINAARPGQPSPRGSLIDTPVATLDADGNAAYEAKLTSDPVVLILIVHRGQVEITEPNGDSRVVSAGRTEIIDGVPEPITSRDQARPSADAMLGRAQTLLVEGEEQAAIKAYRSLLAAHRGTPEARAATLTLARLELERGHAKRALGLFERYLAKGSSGALGETALVGQIEALRRLGRDEAEKAAIDTFIDGHPQSVYAPSMKTRREVLAARGR